MRDANHAAQRKAQQEVLATPLPYTLFDWCQFAGQGQYNLQAGDQVVLEGEPYWTWYEDPPNQQTIMLEHQDAHVIVAPANYTDEILASDAHCPDSDIADVGFAVTFDAVTGEIQYISPGSTELNLRLVARSTRARTSASSSVHGSGAIEIPDQR